jgi:CheY-like chemotaxis protein
MKTKLTKQNAILWADDDSDDLSLVKEAIESLDDSFQMIEASNGREALECLYSLHAISALPCLIVLDINMPVLNGKDTLTILKGDERFRSITVAVFTTSNSEKDRLFCERFGVEMFSKPHTYAGFEKMVSRLLTLCKGVNRNNSTLN